MRYWPEYRVPLHRAEPHEFAPPFEGLGTLAGMQAMCPREVRPPPLPAVIDFRNGRVEIGGEWYKFRDIRELFAAMLEGVEEFKRCGGNPDILWYL